MFVVKMSKKDRSAVSSTPVEQEHISIPENHSVSIYNIIIIISPQ